jgi:hypothetical protein
MSLKTEIARIKDFQIWHFDKIFIACNQSCPDIQSQKCQVSVHHQISLQAKFINRFCDKINFANTQ